MSEAIMINGEALLLLPGYTRADIRISIHSAGDSGNIVMLTGEDELFLRYLAQVLAQAMGPATVQGPEPNCMVGGHTVTLFSPSAYVETVIPTVTEVGGTV